MCSGVQDEEIGQAILASRTQPGAEMSFGGVNHADLKRLHDGDRMKLLQAGGKQKVSRNSSAESLSRAAARRA